MKHRLQLSEENLPEWSEEYDIPDGEDPMVWAQELVDKFNRRAVAQKQPIRALLGIEPISET